MPDLEPQVPDEQRDDGGAGGQGWRVLRPRAPVEERLTVVERMVLRAALDEPIARDPEVRSQLIAARVTSRDLTNYGFYINVRVPHSERASRALGRGTGYATVGFRDSEVPPLAVTTFSADGWLEMVEGHPTGEHGWSADECIRLLMAPLESVFILTRDGKDWANLEE